jgi:hypothetical protein
MISKRKREMKAVAGDTFCPLEFTNIFLDSDSLAITPIPTSAAPKMICRSEVRTKNVVKTITAVVKSIEKNFCLSKTDSPF